MSYRHSPSLEAPIGVFDSGIGGLSILQEIKNQLPNENLLYLADQAHVPYGSRSLEDVRQLSFNIVRFLLDQGAKLISVACNTASAASLHPLREAFPEVPFVGMEPAVKPAAKNTQTKTVGVLATPTTFQGALYASVVERFADGVKILQETLPGLVEQIEKGEIDTAATRTILEKGVTPLLEEGADTVVLACTHFPFVIPLLQELVGDIQVIDPSPAIARQVERLLDNRNLRSNSSQVATTRYVTTANTTALELFLERFGIPPGEVYSATWDEGQLRYSVY
jgi:glutamate racemase